MPNPIPVQRLNHAVLFVRDLDRSIAFYTRAFSFDVIGRMDNSMAFFRARGSSNHHDLGIAAVGANAPRPPRGSTGLYHLAWQVPAIEDLATARETLAELGALVGESDHGVSKSLDAADPDGNEFEVLWVVPEESWENGGNATVAPLDIAAEVRRFGAPQPA